MRPPPPQLVAPLIYWMKKNTAAKTGFNYLCTHGDFETRSGSSAVYDIQYIQQIQYNNCFPAMESLNTREIQTEGQPSKSEKQLGR